MDAAVQWVDGDRSHVRPHLIGALGRALDPQYVGWADQYGAVLYVLGIDTALTIDEVRRRVSRAKPQEPTAQRQARSGS